MFALRCRKCGSKNVIKKEWVVCNDCGYEGDMFESTILN
jgi:ribosomal protein L37E